MDISSAKGLIKRLTSKGKVSPSVDIEKIVLKKDIKELKSKSADSEISSKENIKILTDALNESNAKIEELDLKLKRESCQRRIDDITIFDNAIKSFANLENSEEGRKILEQKELEREQIIKIDKKLEKYET